MSDNNGLQQAMATVLKTQALMQQAMAEFANRFIRIESELADIRAILVRHEELLRNLPEAIRSKIGFQPEAQPAASLKRCARLAFMAFCRPIMGRMVGHF